MKHNFDDAVSPYCTACAQHESFCTTDCSGSVPPPWLMEKIVSGDVDHIDGTWVHLAPDPAVI